MFPLFLSIFLAPGRSVMQICLLSDSEIEMPAKHPGFFSGGNLVIGVHQRPGLKLAQVLAWRLQDGSGIRFSSFEATGVGIQASASGPEPLSSSPLNLIPCNLNECRTAC